MHVSIEKQSHAPSFIFHVKYVWKWMERHNTFFCSCLNCAMNYTYYLRQYSQTCSDFHLLSTFPVPWWQPCWCWWHVHRELMYFTLQFYSKLVGIFLSLWHTVTFFTCKITFLYEKHHMSNSWHNFKWDQTIIWLLPSTAVRFFFPPKIMSHGAHRKRAELSLCI